MENIRLNQEDINDLIAQKIFKDREALFDALESHISDGSQVCLYESYIIDDKYPIICFDDINKFKKWRKGQLTRLNELTNMLNNKNS